MASHVRYARGENSVNGNVKIFVKNYRRVKINEMLNKNLKKKYVNVHVQKKK